MSDLTPANLVLNDVNEQYRNDASQINGLKIKLAGVQQPFNELPEELIFYIVYLIHGLIIIC